MTCIVGLIHEDKVWIGGDRAASEDRHYLTNCSQPKIFRRGGAMFGYTSSFRMGQLLQFKLAVPELNPDKSIDEYMATDFVDAVRQCLKDGGYTKIENSREEVGRFLVGIAGHLYTFDDDYNVRRDGHFAALGSGISVALGSLHTSRGLVSLPQQRILLALEAASRFVTTVRPPFDFMVEGGSAIFTEAAPAA